MVVSLNVKQYPFITQKTKGHGESLLETMQPTNMYLYITKKVFLQCICSFCCIKSHAEMTKKLQVKQGVFHIHFCPCIHDMVLALNMDVFYS